MRLLAIVTLCAAIGAGCADSSNDLPEVAPITVPTTAAPARTTRPVPETVPGELNCEVIRDTLFTLSSELRIVAGLRTQADLNDVRTGAVALDVKAFRAHVEGLRALEQFETPVGSVAETLDLYAEVGRLVEESLLLANAYTVGGPGQQLAALIEDDAVFISSQGSVTFAGGLAGCR